MTDRDIMNLALNALEEAQTYDDSMEKADRNKRAITALQEALAKPVLQDIEQYRLQMAGISTAAIGYWREGDGIHPDYDTIALRDVSKLYAKYDALYKAQQDQAQKARADEREACAKVCDELHPGLATKRAAEIIRART